MRLTQEQYKKIKKYLPKQRSNVSMTNLQILNVLLYMVENECNWRALLKEYGIIDINIELGYEPI